jgi:hypothetical protein
MFTNTYCSSMATLVGQNSLMLSYSHIACIVIFISYQQATLYVSIHNFDKPVNKHIYSYSRLFAATWGHVNETLTSITVL